MRSSTPESGRLRLPNRLRSRRYVPDIGDYREALANRIASLPGNGNGICSVGDDRITIFGLDPTDRYQVMSRGWGRLDRQVVQLFPPRDEQELEVCWRILSYAARGGETIGDAVPRPRKSTWSAELPRFSRTTLQ